MAALVAGALAKASERVATAADGDPLLLGRINTATTLTELTSSTPNITTFRVTSGTGKNSTGVLGRSTEGAGVVGEGVLKGSTGVLGRGTTGVVGQGRFGVTGGGSTGVFGVGTGGSSTGVGGQGVVGVVGSGVGTFGTGVVGSGTIRGVFGSSGGTGVFGSGGTGVFGLGRKNSTGVRGQADDGLSAKGVAGVSRDGYAGYFQGRVYATDSVTTEGTLSISARHPDGTRRRLDSLASPLSYFQDFGRATLVNGRASVPLDPDFASLVNNDDYLVFLTPEARTRGLFVFSKSPTGFEVRDRDDEQGGDDNEKKQQTAMPFVWQLVARRRDITGAAARLEQQTAPTPVPELPAMPELSPIPELPSTPELPEVPQAAP